MFCAGGGEEAKKGSNDTLKTHTQGPPYTPPHIPRSLGVQMGSSWDSPSTTTPPHRPPLPPTGGGGLKCPNEMSQMSTPHHHSPQKMTHLMKSPALD